MLYKLLRVGITKGRYDVIVVGAGPAGSIAAKTTAKSGLSTLLVEKRQEIGEQVRCAEGVPIFQIKDFVDPDPKWICASISKARIHGPDNGFADFKDTSIQAYIMDRKVFDRDLACMAADAGADVISKARVDSLIMNGTVSGIRGKHMGEPFEASSKVVIGADGIESKVGRMAGINTALKLKDIESCVQFHLAGLDIDASRAEFFFGNETAPGGYAWVFPKGEGEANVGLGVLGTRIGDKKPVEYLRDFVNRRFPEAREMQMIVGACPVSGAIMSLSTGGLILAGDAGRLCDPITGGGIINAMTSGRIAANAAIECIEEGNVSADSLKRYDRRIDAEIGPTLRRNYKLKEWLTSASDRKLNAVIKAMRIPPLSNMTINEFLHEVFGHESLVLGMITHIP